MDNPEVPDTAYPDPAERKTAGRKKAFLVWGCWVASRLATSNTDKVPAPLIYLGGGMLAAFILDDFLERRKK